MNASGVQRPTGVTAVVLVGGGSRRMGRDKAQLVVDGRTLTERVLDTLRPFADASLLAGRALPGLDVLAIPDHYPDAGPLGGIASALAAVQTPLALVAACDMPSIAPALVQLLLAGAAAHPEAAAVMCRGVGGHDPGRPKRRQAGGAVPRQNPGRPKLCQAGSTGPNTGPLEPLLSVWRPPLALPHLQAALDAGERAIHVAVAQLDTALILPPAEWQQADPTGESFVNWNAPEDLPAPGRTPHREAHNAGPWP